MPIDRRLMRFCRHFYCRGANDSGEYSPAEIYLAINSATGFCGIRQCIGEMVFTLLDKQLADSSFVNSPQGFFTRLVMYLQKWVKVLRQGDKLLSVPLLGEEGLEDAILESIIPYYYGNTLYPGYYTMSVSFPSIGGSALRVDGTPPMLLELIRDAWNHECIGRI